MAKDTETQTAAQPARIFATAPSDIVVFEAVPYDEPVLGTIRNDVTGKTDGVRRVVGRNRGETIHVRSERAHIEGKTAHPIDGSDPLPYGPGLAGHWGKHSSTGK